MKIFKNLVLISALVLSGNLSWNQACKKYMTKDATDEFTGASIFQTNKVVYSQPTIADARAVSFTVLDGNRIYFHLSSGRSQDLVFGSDVILTFDDGEKLTLQIEQISKLKEGTEFVTHANCRIYYKADVERFYSQHVTKINLLGSRQEFDMNKSDQTAILASALCLVENAGIDNLNFSSERNTTLVPDPSAASFSTGSSSFVSISVNVKCEYEKDTLLDGGNIVKLSKRNELASAPYKLYSQLSLNDNKIKLLLTYSVDLGNLNSSSYVVFKFVDGSALLFKYDGPAVNSEKPTFELDITRYKEDFLSKDLAAIRLSYSEYFADLPVGNKRYLADYLRYCFP
jgi:hypothetical protein